MRGKIFNARGGIRDRAAASAIGAQNRIEGRGGNFQSAGLKWTAPAQKFSKNLHKSFPKSRAKIFKIPRRAFPKFRAKIFKKVRAKELTLAGRLVYFFL
ncbi:MAG TPA: hypothetical protein H9851_03445 [Candidatus Borkfalkia faecavium]|uniref:Uncharacterized protein n=1 Tax=Candidatus Borkfalkia faecavium TaxID=2838508 RepID=A0A9D2AUF8_9FIRM|nr:hypothetical protein [Candidatus Borkfalkia faecavium]